MTLLLTGIISLLLFSGPEGPETTSRVREDAIYFRCDKSTYEDNYRSNAKAVEKLVSLLEEIGTERLDSICVKAYASPEGVYEHNMLLSRRRAQSFQTALWTRLGLEGKDIPITVLPGGEAWEQLRTHVAADSTMSRTARDRTLALLDDASVSRPTKKWRMMHNYLGTTPEEGDVYRWLLRNHYVRLRYLDIKIHYQEDVPTVREEPPAGTEEIPAQTDTTAVEPAQTLITPPEPEQPVTPQSDRKGTPVIGLSTNLLFDATWIPHYGFTSVPSLSLEYYPARGHWTFGADVDWSSWRHYDTHRFNQIHNLTLHARRYFRSGEEGFRGLYLQGALNAAEYGLGWDAHGWEGELLGINAGLGYKLNWGRFFLDMGLDLGFFYSKNDPYFWGADEMGWYYYDYTGDPAIFRPRQKGFTWLGPTRAYISIGVDLFTRRR